jgi:predicted dienelactone hydrolase
MSDQERRDPAVDNDDESFPVLRADVAGIDVGSEEHWVCAPALTGEGREVARFAATTPGIEAVIAWLQARSVTSVALESRGARNPIAAIVNGFSAYTAAACCAARFGRVRRSAYCARWCGTKERSWRNGVTGCVGCRRASIR